MPTTINPIRKQIVKEARLKGKSKVQALKAAGYSEATYNHHGHDIPVIKCVDKEIMTEATKRKIIDKAWKVCEEGLESGKVKYTLGQALATKDMTEKHKTDLSIEDNSHSLLTKHRLSSILHP